MRQFLATATSSKAQKTEGQTCGRDLRIRARKIRLRLIKTTCGDQKRQTLNLRGQTLPNLQLLTFRPALQWTWTPLCPLRQCMDWGKSVRDNYQFYHYGNDAGNVQVAIFIHNAISTSCLYWDFPSMIGLCCLRSLPPKGASERQMGSKPSDIVESGLMCRLMNGGVIVPE